MLGAGKLNIEQVKQIKQLLQDNVKVKEIAEQFQISKVMVNLIKNGKRWSDNRDKIKYQIEEFTILPSITEKLKISDKIGTFTFESKICPIITPNGKLYIILHYMNDKLTSEKFSGLFETIPTMEKLQKSHDKFVLKVL